MKRRLLMLFTCLLMVTYCQAQLSTGKPTSSVMKTGNRPGAGDFGIFIGPSYSEIKDMIDEKISFRGVPLVNFKYFASQNLEWRLGIQLYRKMEKLKGDLTQLQMGEDLEETENMGSETSKKVDGYCRFTPGFAWHFSPKNILDVYVGANLPFGWIKDKMIDEYVYEGDTEKNNLTRSSFAIGFGAFIGLQVFIADLPFAVGLEYGFSGLRYLGVKYKHEIENAEGSCVYYTKEKGDEKIYSKLKSSKGEFGADARVTFSYYFR